MASIAVPRDLQVLIEQAALIVVAEAIDRETPDGGRELVLRVEQVVSDRTGEGFSTGDEVLIDRGTWPAGQGNLSRDAESLIENRERRYSTVPTDWHPRAFVSGARYLALLRPREDGSFVSIFGPKFRVSPAPTDSVTGLPAEADATWLRVYDWRLGGIRFPVDFPLVYAGMAGGNACRNGEVETFIVWFRLDDFEALLEAGPQPHGEGERIVRCDVPVASSAEVLAALGPSSIAVGGDDWVPRSGVWTVADGTITGTGALARDVLLDQLILGEGRPSLEWAFLELGRATPAEGDFVVSVEVAADDGLAELALGICEDRFTRVYVYPSEGSVVIGEGQVESGSLAGGPALEEVLVDGLAYGTWHRLEAWISGGTLIVSYDGVPLAELRAPAGLRECPRMGLRTGHRARWRGFRMGPAE
jgi:hypothetical protein